MACDGRYGGDSQPVPQRSRQCPGPSYARPGEGGGVKSGGEPRPRAGQPRSLRGALIRGRRRRGTTATGRGSGRSRPVQAAAGECGAATHTPTGYPTGSLAGGAAGGEAGQPAVVRRERTSARGPTASACRGQGTARRESRAAGGGGTVPLAMPHASDAEQATSTAARVRPGGKQHPIW